MNVQTLLLPEDDRQPVGPQGPDPTERRIRRGRAIHQQLRQGIPLSRILQAHGAMARHDLQVFLQQRRGHPEPAAGELERA